MSWRVSHILTLVAGLALAACGTEGRTAHDSAAADTTQAIARPDSIAAPRVVPYDPATPGAMRNGDSVIKARTPQATAPATPAPRAASGTTGPATSKPAVPPQRPAAEPVATDSIGDPVAIVRAYYAAIRAHDFLRAYRMWQVSGQAGGRSYAPFAAGFDSTESVDARTGVPGRVEGAAGSRFVTVPVEIDSRLRDGTRQRFTGSVTLRRVEVPGASAAQRRWHLYASNIRQVQ